MTQNPESTSVETPIVEALHIMHEGKFLHLPVTDKGEKSETISTVKSCENYKGKQSKQQKGFWF